MGIPTVLTPSDMAVDTFRLVDRIDVQAGVQIAYCRNWTVQSQLQTSIPSDHKDLYAQEWLTKTAKSTDVAAAYKSFAEPVQQTTYLLTALDAQKEALRRLKFYSVQRQVYQFDGFAPCILLELAQPVLVRHYRYGMAMGVQGIVTKLTTDYMNATVVVQVMV